MCFFVLIKLNLGISCCTANQNFSAQNFTTILKQTHAHTFHTRIRENARKRCLVIASVLVQERDDGVDVSFFDDIECLGTFH